jgi:hypothetical protein
MNSIWKAVTESPLVRAPLAPWADGHYSNIDWGKFVVKDGFAYFPDGDVYDMRVSQPARIFPHDNRIDACPEDYSAWSDDRRCLEQAITQAERDADEDARIAYYTKRDALVEQAKAKLTEEEFDAVFELGRDD